MWPPFWSLMSISRKSLSYLKLHLRKPEASPLRNLWLTTSFDFPVQKEIWKNQKQHLYRLTFFFFNAFFVLANFYLHNISTSVNGPAFTACFSYSYLVTNLLFLHLVKCIWNCFDCPQLCGSFVFSNWWYFFQQKE